MEETRKLNFKKHFIVVEYVLSIICLAISFPYVIWLIGPLSVIVPIFYGILIIMIITLTMYYIRTKSNKAKIILMFLLSIPIILEGVVLIFVMTGYIHF